MSSSEIFAALFELELSGKGAADAGEEFCEKLLEAISCQLSAVSFQLGTVKELHAGISRILKVWEKAHRSDA